ncbi:MULTISPECIES: sugar transferase [Microvirga]|uniref:sugar transferase n=1 Tax=Microvirga TaxID=186650 RepID=UPI0021C59C43|nr:sugar transferase [Microvirga sp. HBU67655]
MRRLLDIVISLSALVILSPVIILVTLAIALETGRPILFSQMRIGHNGRPFRMYKFRKFRCDCGPDGSPLTLENDDRSTKVGKILMATKLDEVPQFLNVLRGDMAIVGPRPESFAFADCFSGPYMEVLKYKPGIVGPTQIAFRNESDLYTGHPDPGAFYRAVLFPMKADMDLQYYSRRTLTTDIACMFKAAIAILRRASSIVLSSSEVKGRMEFHAANIAHKSLETVTPERSNL